MYSLEAGTRIGRLTVLQKPKLIDKTVLCKCDCGVEKQVSITSIQRGSTRSCGCLRREKATAVGRNMYAIHIGKANEDNRRYGTNIGIIQKTTLNARNKTGVTGVWYNAANNYYVAYISLRKKRIFLGNYTSLAAAAAARKAAEEKYFAPIIAKYESEKM